MATLIGTRLEPTDEPIRAELFSVERLEQHARTMAEAQMVSRRRGRLRLISQRLAENGEVLLASYRELSKAIREEALLTPGPSGWSTTSISWRASSGRFGKTFRPPTEPAGVRPSHPG